MLSETPRAAVASEVVRGCEPGMKLCCSRASWSRRLAATVGQDVERRMSRDPPVPGGLGRPEPVLDVATTLRTLGLVVGVVVAVLVVFGVDDVTDELIDRIIAATTLVGAAEATWSIAVPLRAAWKARAQMTSVARPATLTAPRWAAAMGSLAVGPCSRLRRKSPRVKTGGELPHSPAIEPGFRYSRLPPMIESEAQWPPAGLTRRRACSATMERTSRSTASSQAVARRL